MDKQKGMINWVSNSDGSENTKYFLELDQFQNSSVPVLNLDELLVPVPIGPTKSLFLGLGFRDRIFY